MAEAPYCTRRQSDSSLPGLLPMKHDPTLLFIHIPKSAGISLLRILWARYGCWPPNRLFEFRHVFGDAGNGDHRERLDRIQAMGSRDKQRVKVFTGHLGYGGHEFLPPPVFQFTVLREPLARSVSSLKYVFVTGIARPADSVEELALSDEHPAKKFFLDNAQVRYLAGEHGDPYDGPVGSVTQQMTDVAIERLLNEIDSVGLTERLDEFITLLGLQLGWKFNFMLRLNQTKKHAAKTGPEHVVEKSTQLSDTAIRRLSELNQLDQQLYQAAKERFEQDIADQGGNFQHRLDLVRLRSQRYAGTIEHIDNFRRKLMGKA